jgi:hypothetical protein
MTEFDTYPGASTISRKTLDWKRSKISMFELDIVPQSWIPYVQMGLNITQNQHLDTVADDVFYMRSVLRYYK